MRSEQERQLRMLHLREREALARIAQEEQRAYEAIDQIVVSDQEGFDAVRRQLEEAWCALEGDRSALREAEAKAAALHDSRLTELQKTAHQLAKHHLVVVEKKRKTAEKRLQLDLLLRQLNIQLGRKF